MENVWKIYAMENTLKNVGKKMEMKKKDHAPALEDKCTIKANSITSILSPH